MKINLSADVHVGVPGKLDDIMWSLNRMREYNAANDIKYWFILGDLFHDREAINVRDLCIITQFLADTRDKYHQEIHTFPGNHDMFMKNSWEINSLIPLGRYIEVHNKVDMVVLDGVRFWILPFIHYESEYMKILAKIEKRYKAGDILLTHIGVKQATLNTCFLLKSWSVVEFTNSPFHVYTGHFHSQQQVGDNLWYPGSPIPFKFDEGDVDHGFYVFDTETRTHEFISIWAGAEGDTKAPPQFLTLDEELINGRGAEEIRGNIIRVALSKEYTHNQLIEMKEHLTNLGARDVRWMTLASKETKEGMIVAAQAAASASELFERFLSQDNDGVKGLGKDILLRINAEVVAEGDRRYEFSGDPE